MAQNRIKELRKNLNLTLRELKEKLSEFDISVNESQLSKWEKNLQSPRDDKVWTSLSEIFNVSQSYLMGFSDNEDRYRKDEEIFHVGVAWQAEALSIMKQIIAAQNSVLSNELMTASLVQRFWLEIYENVDISYEKDCQNNLSSSEARLQLMMQYIHLNYLRNISLDEIATHAMASKSTALNLFRKYLHVTPVKYLINYRLKEAAILLSKTEKKVNTISDETGFNNVEYFCRIFKKHYHLTPSEYRNEKQWKSYDR